MPQKRIVREWSDQRADWVFTLEELVATPVTKKGWNSWTGKKETYISHSWEPKLASSDKDWVRRLIQRYPDIQLFTKKES